jgi:uncharacterized protein (TIGR03435 family)
VTRNLLIVAAMFIALPIWAQPAAGPEFEVASVKPDPSAGGISVLVPAHGKLMGKGVSLMRLISFAYDLPFPRISGPSWLDSDRFSVFAKGKSDARDTEIKPMTQALLAERFGLQCHRETKAARVFFLVLASGGLKAPRADTPKPPNPKFPPGPHHTMGGDATMEEFAARISKGVGDPVIDPTGITGTFHTGYPLDSPDPNLLCRLLCGFGAAD